MMMVVLRLHPGTEVFDESRASVAFVDYCLRDLAVIRDLVEGSRAALVCFKPLMDSHRAPELLESFPEGRVLWMLRHWGDVANSTLNKFEDPNVNLRHILEDRPGGDGLRREISKDSLRILRKIYRSDMGEPDLACLRWWSRNRVLLEKELHRDERVRIQPYEELVEGGRTVMADIFRWTGLEPSDWAVRHVHSRSVGKNPAPPLDARVEELCRALHAELLQRTKQPAPTHTK